MAGAVSAVRDAVRANAALGREVQGLEGEVQGRRAATQARLLGLRGLEQTFRGRVGETERAVERLSPTGLYRRLGAGAVEQEGVVRGVEEGWLAEGGTAGEREVGVWLARVQEVGRVEFLRGEAAARWDEGRVGGWR